MPIKFTKNRAYHVVDGRRDYMSKKQGIAIYLAKKRKEQGLPPYKPKA